MPDRLLFVDDEPYVLAALRRSFEGARYDVVTAAGAEEGLSRLVDSGPFQVVCSDYRMPGMSGAAFLARARELDPRAFRVMLTAHEEFDVARDAINQGGVQRYVSKPWTPTELLAVVQDASERYRLQQRNDELTRVLHEKNRQLETANRELERLVAERTTSLLEGLTCALDYRDTETQWHSRRVAAYTRRLAEQLGLTGPELVDIEQGALLHDIGKIGVPDAILLKPGPLTPEEWVVMKTHPERGYQLLRNIPYLEKARVVVLHHQERWDGKGYPQSLRGTAIAVGARIFSVADAFDAITSDRPYRRGRPYELARDELVRCAGTQFDPEVVRAFCDLPRSEFDGIRLAIEALEREDLRRRERDAAAITRRELLPVG